MTPWFVRGEGAPRVVAVVHLGALPGAPLYAGDMAALRRRALREAKEYEAAGADALVVENFGDAPFFPGAVPAVTVAAMAVVTADLVDAVRCPVGVNVLRNDVASALSIAAATGAAFVRVNVHAGARLTDQGIVEGRAHETLRLRAALRADVAIFADVAVKHSAPIAPRPLGEEAVELHERALADALLVTGIGTGHAPRAEDLLAVRRAAPAAPIFVGSGVTPENAAALLAHADGCIVGSALKHDGDARREVDPPRAARVIAALHAARAPHAPT